MGTMRLPRSIASSGAGAGHTKSPQLVPAALIALAVGLVLSFGVAKFVGDRNGRIAASHFAQASAHVISQIEARVALYEKALRGLRGAIAAIGPDVVTSEELGRYADTRDIDIEFPGLRGYGFIRRVARRDEAGFVGRLRTDGDPGFAFHQTSPRDGERYVIEFVAPAGRNAKAIGLDVASEEHRRAAAYRAMETGRATMTAPVTLVQATGQEGRGFLLFLPITTPGAETRTVEARKSATVGWSYGAFVIDDILAGAAVDEGISVSIRDRASGNGPFFGRDVAPDDSPTLTYTKSLPVYGREWDVAMRARPTFVGDLGLLRPRVAAFVVFALSVLVAWLLAVRTLASRSRREAAASPPSWQARRTPSSARPSTAS